MGPHGPINIKCHVISFCNVDMKGKCFAAMVEAMITKRPRCMTKGREGPTSPPQKSPKRSRLSDNPRAHHHACKIKL